MGPRGYAALGNALISGGDIIDRINSESLRQKQLNQSAKDKQEDSDADRQNQLLRNQLLLQNLIDRRVEANRKLDEKQREDRNAANTGLKEFSETSWVAGTGPDGGNLHITDEGVSSGARRVYDPKDPRSIESYRASLAENEIGLREEIDGGIQSKDVRSILANANVLNTPEGQRVNASYYRPENDASNRANQKALQAERIAAAANRQAKAIAAAKEKANTSGGAGMDVPTLESMLIDAKQQQIDLLSTAGDDYKIGMDRGMDAQMSVIGANIKSIQNLLNRARAVSGNGKTNPTVPVNTLGLQLPN